MQNPQEAWLAETRARRLGSGVVEIDGRSYEYDVLPASFVPVVPYFVLYPFGERLFISEQVAERYRASFCASEVRNFILQRSGIVEHFRMAVEQEIAGVPADDAVDYLTMRMLSFESLLGPIGKSLVPEYFDQIAECRDLFKNKLAGLMSLTKH